MARIVGVDIPNDKPVGTTVSRKENLSGSRARK